MSTTTPLTITQLQARAYANSKAKGFHDTRPADDDPNLTHYRLAKIALIHSELSELLEEIRRGEPMTENYYPMMDTHDSGESPYQEPDTDGTGKPTGVPSECADILIRLLDFCEAENIDLEAATREKMRHNAQRTNMHGGKLA